MEENVKERLQRKATQAGVPISGTFELTPRCNLQCRMCYVRMPTEEMKPYGRELTAQEWISIGEQATQSGMLLRARSEILVLTVPPSCEQKRIALRSVRIICVA